MSLNLTSKIIFALNHCPVLSVRCNDFSEFHVEQIFAFKIILFLREVWNAYAKHALQQYVVFLCP